MRLAPLLTQALGKTGNGAWCEVSTPMIAQSRSAPAFPPERVRPTAAVETLTPSAHLSDLALLRIYYWFSFLYAC